MDQVVDGWRRLHPEVDATAVEIGQRLIWAGRVLQEVLEAAAVQAGFRRRGDYEVLALLRRAEPDQLSPIDVAGRLRASPSGLTGKIDRLEREGLIERKPHPDDRRGVLLAITPNGRRRVDRAFALGVAVYADLVAPLDDAARRDVAAALATIQHRLAELADPAAPG